MFSNPGKKLLTITKIMFWVICAVFFAYDALVAIITSAIITGFVRLLNSFSSFPSLLGGGTIQYAGMSAGPFVFLVWLCAIFFAILFFVLMYWSSLIVITSGDTNIEVKEIKSTLATQANESYAPSGTVNSVQQQNTWNTHPAPVYQPAPAYQPIPVYQENPVVRPEPIYQPVYQEAPERIVAEEIPSAPQPTYEETVQNYTPPKEEKADEVVVNTDTRQLNTKEDILNKYGPRGDVYK